MKLFIVAMLCVAVHAQTTLAVPHFADGNGWKSTLVLVDESPSPQTANVYFFDPNGGQVSLPIVGIGSTNVLGTTFTGNDSTFGETAGSASTTTTGWMQIETSGHIHGTLIFRQRVQGRPDFEASIPIVPAIQNDVIPFDNTNGFSTGLAMVNPFSVINQYSIIFRTESGVILGSHQITLAVRNQTSFSVSQMFPETAGQRGSMQLTVAGSGGQNGFNWIALRFNPTGAFTTLTLF